MNIFVGNLTPNIVAEDLRKAFSEFGEIISAKVIIDSATGVSRCFGFVEMADFNSAQDAIDNLDFSYFQGSIISVKEAKPTAKPGNKGYGNNAGGARPFKPKTFPRPGGYKPGGYSKPGGESTGGYNNKNY